MLGEKKNRTLPKHFSKGNVDEVLGQRQTEKGLGYKYNGSKFSKREPFFRREDNITPIKKPIGTSTSSTDQSNDKSTEHIHISASQKEVLEAIMQRKSVFFTGSAGTGKSYILRILQDVLSSLNLSDKVAITAPTGVAACNISGLTIHSWSGLGLGKEPIDQLVNRISKVAKKRWIETDILIIDEISMLSGDMFDKLSKIGSRMRNDSRPFGGVQLILCGDFFQLPPVGKTNYCFDSQAWKQLFDTKVKKNMFVLDKVFRQKNDLTFLEILNELREGIVSDRAIYAFNQTKQRNFQSKSTATDLAGGFDCDTSNDDIRPTKLFSTNAEVDAYNAAELSKLPNKTGQFFIYAATDSGSEPYLTQMRAGTKAPQSLELRVDSQVMLLKNLDTSRGLVNGARGVVVGFEASSHRSKYYNMLPIVKFECTVGSNKSVEEIVLIEESWEVKSGESVVASREQMPLMLAWAISIHKSQGMTIPKLEVNLGQIFEYGQGYVALSRATCLSGLIVHNFERSRIKAHDSVRKFYHTLKTASAQQTGGGASNGGELVVTSLAELSAMFSAPTPHTVDRDEWLDKRQPPPPSIDKENSVQNLCEMDEWLDAPFSVAATKNIQKSSNSEVKPSNDFHLKRKSEDQEDENTHTESSGGPFSASFYNSMQEGIGMNMKSNNCAAAASSSSSRFDNSSSTFKTPFQVHHNTSGPFSSGSASQRHTGGSNLFGSSSQDHVSGSRTSSGNLESGNGSAGRSSGSGILSAIKSAAAVHQTVVGPFSSSTFSKQQTRPGQLAGADSFSVFRCRDSSIYTNGPFSSAPSPYEKQSNCIDLSGGDIKLTNTQEISIEMQRKIEASRQAAIEKLRAKQHRDTLASKSSN